MIASAYLRATSEGKSELLDMYVTNLCVDDAPMVRRAAAKQLGAIASKVGSNQVLAKIMPAYEKLCVKDTDSVRIIAMGQTSTLANMLDDDNSRKETLLRIIEDCHKDRSWRVRCALAADLGKIASASGASFTKDSLLNISIVLLGDPEPEVREVALKQLSTICSVIGSAAFVETILPELNATRFSEEEEIKVQTAFAQAIMDLIPLLGEGGDDNNEQVKKQLLPLITHALTLQLDEESEGFQHMMQAMINMKLKVFRRMDDLISVLTPDGAQSFTDDVLLSVVGQCSVDEHYEDSK
jgi:serine/threonine-protein phosphatase 2A regulatory subunit A